LKKAINTKTKLIIVEPEEIADGRQEVKGKENGQKMSQPGWTRKASLALP
jgi:hypothetical protein